MKHSIVYTNRQLVEILNLPENTIEFKLHAKAGELPVIEISTMVGVDELSLKEIIKTHKFKLELIPKKENEPG